MKRVCAENRNTVGYWNGRFAAGDYFDWDNSDLASCIAWHIPTGATVLDAGSGAAMFPRRIAPLRPDVRFTVSDFSHEALKRLELRFPAVAWDVREPYRGAPFDVVTATEVLEHLDDPEGAMANMAAAALALLIVTVPNADSISSYEHVWEFSMEDLVALLARHGTPSVVHARGGSNLLGVCRLCK